MNINHANNGSQSIESQCAAILRHLRHSSITPIEALNQYGCFRLGARIFELKQQGHNITTTMINKNGKRFAEYSLERSND